MTQLGFLFDPSRCFGCQGCVAACVNTNGTPPDLFWRRVHKLPPEPNDSHTQYLSISCNHCENAPCVAACPAEALRKRPEDGIVVHDATVCLGCRYCQMACPYNAPQWDEARGVISKCNLCVERLDQGLEPACVATCFAGALQLIQLDEGREAWVKEAPGLCHLPKAKPSIRFTSQPPENFPPAMTELP